MSSAPTRSAPTPANCAAWTPPASLPPTTSRPLSTRASTWSARAASSTIRPRSTRGYTVPSRRLVRAGTPRCMPPAQPRLHHRGDSAHADVGALRGSVGARGREHRHPGRTSRRRNRGRATNHRVRHPLGATAPAIPGDLVLRYEPHRGLGPAATGWRLTVDGDAPLDIDVRMPIPLDRTAAVSPGYTANRAVNAVPFVCAAEPGTGSTLGLPQIVETMTD